MNEISDTALIAALRRQMTIAVAKQVASAGNLANVDTPGYKADEVTFDAALDDSLTPPAADAHRAHLDGVARGRSRSTEIAGRARRAATATTCSSIASC